MDQALLPVLTLAIALGADSARAAAPRTVAIVTSDDQPAYRAAREGFEARARELDSEARFLRPTAIDPDLPKHVDLIFVIGSDAARAVALLRPTVPLVFAMVADPEAIGLAGKPDVSGVSLSIAASRRWQLIAQIAPDLRRPGVVCAPGSRRGRELAAAAKAFGIQARLLEVRSSAEVGAALVAAGEHLDGIIAVQDPGIWDAASVKASVIFSLKSNKPLFGFSTSFTRGGAVASIAAEDFAGAGAQAADRADNLLDGLRGLGVAEPKNLTISINLVIARRLGLEPPRAILDQATTVLR